MFCLKVVKANGEVIGEDPSIDGLPNVSHVHIIHSIYVPGGGGGGRRLLKKQSLKHHFLVVTHWFLSQIELNLTCLDSTPLRRC